MRRVSPFDPTEEQGYGTRNHRNTWGHLNDAKRMRSEERDFWIGWMLSNADDYTPQHFLRVLRVSNGFSTRDVGHALGMEQHGYSHHETTPRSSFPLKRVLAILDQNLFRLPEENHEGREATYKAVSSAAAAVVLKKLRRGSTRILFSEPAMKEQLFAALKAEIRAYKAGELPLEQLPRFSDVVRVLVRGKHPADILPALAGVEDDALRNRLAGAVCHGKIPSELKQYLSVFKDALDINDAQLELLRHLPIGLQTGSQKISDWGKQKDMASVIGGLDALKERALMVIQRKEPYSTKDETDMNAGQFLRIWRAITGDKLKDVGHSVQLPRQSIQQIETNLGSIRPSQLEYYIATNPWRLPENGGGMVREDIVDILRRLNDRVITSRNARSFPKSARDGGRA